ncbi:hypothetical protein ACRJ4W_10865 [Streptomyces sp. GLT-R25]
MLGDQRSHHLHPVRIAAGLCEEVVLRPGETHQRQVGMRAAVQWQLEESRVGDMADHPGAQSRQPYRCHAQPCHEALRADHDVRGGGAQVLGEWRQFGDLLRGGVGLEPGGETFLERGHQGHVALGADGRVRALQGDRADRGTGLAQPVQDRFRFQQCHFRVDGAAQHPGEPGGGEVVAELPPGPGGQHLYVRTVRAHGGAPR